MPDAKDIADYNSTRDANACEVLCYVPFSHMFFSFNGVVQNCCFSGKQSYLGRWPTNSIHDIWFGDTFQKFRHAIRQNDLSLGCMDCEQRISERDFENVPAKCYDYYAKDTNIDLTGYPQVMEFELDNTCNLECVMCDGRFSSSIRRNREKIAPYVSPYNDEFIRQLEEFIPHLNKALFYGGEPFMSSIYLDIWGKMLELNPNIEIRAHTNGTFLNQRIKNILEAGRFSLSVSIDAMEKNLFESVRLNSNFDRVMEHLDYFIAYCRKRDTEFAITPSPTIDTWFEIPKLLRYANNKGIRIVYNIVTHPKNLALRSLGSEELKNIHEILSSENIPNTTADERANSIQYNNFLTHLHHLFLQAKQTEEVPQDSYYREEIDDFLKSMHKYLRDEFEPAEWASGEEIIEAKAKKFLDEAKALGHYSSAVRLLNKTEPQDILRKYPHAVSFDLLKEQFPTFHCSDSN